MAGVKLVLPALLAGVDSKAWRSKQGSVQMLGAMAYLAPQPLSTALPRVVPKLSQTLSDPHPKVQSAARQALKEVSLLLPYQFLRFIQCTYPQTLQEVFNASQGTILGKLGKVSWHGNRVFEWVKCMDFPEEKAECFGWLMPKHNVHFCTS